MKLLVKTLRGSIELQDLLDSVSVGDVKRMLHEQHKEEPVAVPEPQLQRLVYKGRVLRDGTATLADAGLSSGDVVVLLLPPRLPPPPEPVSSPAPDAAAIRAAIADEARARGLDPNALLDRAAPSRSRRGGGLALNLPVDLLNMDPRVLQLLQQALDGGGLLGNLDAAAAADTAGPAGAAADEGEAEVEDVVPPEPPVAAVEQLSDMGFAAPIVRKALLLSRNSVDLALEWLLQHAEEPGVADPPTQEQLRAVWGTRRRRRVAAAPRPAAAAAAGVGTEPVPAAPATGGGAAGTSMTGSGTAAGSAAGTTHGAADAAGAAAPAAASATVAPTPGAGRRPVTAANAVAVAQLVEMGFSADAATRALRRYGGSVDHAVAALLSASPSEGGAPADGAGLPSAAGEVSAGEAGPAAMSAGQQQQQQQPALPPQLQQQQPQQQQEHWQQQPPRPQPPQQQQLQQLPRDQHSAQLGESSPSLEQPCHPWQQEEGQQQPAGDADMHMADAPSPRADEGAAAPPQPAMGASTAAVAAAAAAAAAQADREEEMVDAEEGSGAGPSDEYEEGIEWVEDSGEGGEDEEEEFLDPDGGEAIQQLGNALGTLGSMDLAQLGSADMEQLLQGINIDELVGSQLFPGAVEPGSLGSNAHDVLLRIMESPGLLHQVLHAAPSQAAQQAGQQAGQGQQAQQAPQPQPGPSLQHSTTAVGPASGGAQ